MTCWVQLLLILHASETSVTVMWFYTILCYSCQCFRTLYSQQYVFFWLFWFSIVIFLKFCSTIIVLLLVRNFSTLLKVFLSFWETFCPLWRCLKFVWYVKIPPYVVIQSLTIQGGSPNTPDKSTKYCSKRVGGMVVRVCLRLALVLIWWAHLYLRHYTCDAMLQTALHFLIIILKRGQPFKKFLVLVYYFYY